MANVPSLHFNFPRETDQPGASTVTVKLLDVESSSPGVENVVTRQFLCSGDHFLPTDDTDIVRGLQVLGGSIGVSEQR